MTLLKGALLVLLISVSGFTQASVTRTFSVGGGDFTLEIEDLPSQLIHSGINNRPLQRLDTIRGSIHYSNQQQGTRLAENRNRQISELDRIEVEIKATPRTGVIAKETQVANAYYYHYDLVERSEKAPITLTDSSRFICTRTGSETIRIEATFSGYQVTNAPIPGASSYVLAGLYFTAVSHVETIDMTVPCIKPEDHPNVVKRAWRLQGDDIALWSEIELVLIPPTTVNVGEPINVIGLARYKSQQTTGTSIGFGSNFRASTIDSIAVGGHVRLVPRTSTSLVDPAISPVRERAFAATALARVGEVQAIDTLPFRCAKPGRAALRWEIDDTMVFAHDNATPGSQFKVPNVRQMELDTSFECVFNPSNRITKTVYANGALLDVVATHQDQIIDGRQQHQVSATVTYNSQAPRTTLESLGTQDAISINNQVVARGATLNIQSTFSCPATGRFIHNLPVNIGSVRKTVWYPDGSSDSAVMTSPTPVIPVAVTCRDRELWGLVVANEMDEDVPLPNMNVRMVINGRTYYTNTDRAGYFDFADASGSLIYSDSDQATVRLVFADGKNANPQNFRFVEQAAADTVYVETGPMPVTRFSNAYVLGAGAPWPSTNIPNANADDQIKLADYGVAFSLYSRAVRFANQELGVGFVSTSPLVVSMYDTAIRTSHYSTGDNRIRLEPEDSRPNYYWYASSVMMHELGHAVDWHSQIGGRRAWATPRHSRKETYHLGRSNLSTTDSWHEGFANWFSSIVMRRYSVPLWDYHWGTPRAHGLYSFPKGVTRNLNDQFKTYGNLGRDEEWAVAGVLWDVRDHPAFYEPQQDSDGTSDEVTVPMWRLWPTLNKPGTRDFKDVYDALKGLAPHYSGWQAKLDTIFREHGVFVDADGDEKYDAGETIGRSAWDNTTWFTQHDVNKDGDVDDHWPDSLPAGTAAAIPQLRTASGDLTASPAGSAGRRTSSNSSKAELGLQDENGNTSNVELRERMRIRPHVNRRNTEVPPDLYLQYTIEDRDGNTLPEAVVRVYYEYDPPKDWQNYQTATRVPGQGGLPILVPVEGRLRIEMFAGNFLSNQATFDEQTVETNSVQNSGQGNALFTIPATAAEIAQILSVSSPHGQPPGPGSGGTPPGSGSGGTPPGSGSGGTPPGSGSGGTTPGTGTAPTPGTGGTSPGTGGGLSSVTVLIIVVALLFIGWLFVRRP
jgi:hypothetical protein